MVAACRWLAFALGVALCFCDAPPPEAAGASAVPPSALGDFFGLLSGLGLCVYLTFAETLRPHLDSAVFLAAVMLQYTCVCVLAACASPSPPTLSLDPQTGLFGWLQPSLARMGCQLWMTLAVDMTGTLGLVAVMKYVPGLIVAVSLLLSPLIATLEGLAIGAERIPGPWTMAGAAVVVVASAVLVSDAQQQSTTVELKATELI